MNNYYVEFLGELKNNRKIQRRFFKHYNKWCDIINEEIPRLNEEFDNNWKGEPITDYSKIPEYDAWMVSNYRAILKKNGMDKQLDLEYKIDDELQLYAVGRFGSIKNKKISFVLRKG